MQAAEADLEADPRVAEVVAAARAADVRLVRFEYCDVSGVAHAKAIHVDQLAHKMVEGVGLTRAQMALNLLEQVVPIEGMEPVGEIRLVPDPTTFTVLPWSPGSASVLCDQLDHDRTDWGACPRSFLRRVVDRAAAMGITVQATFENEYYLGTEIDGRFEPVDAPTHAPVYSAIGHDHLDGLMLETVDALTAQGIVVEQCINEYGPGQREISVRHTDALGAADQQLKFRDTVRGVASRHGILASFAAKPYPDEIGSGAHIHFSLWGRAGEGGRSLLYDPAVPGGLSPLGRHFIAGVAEHLPALTALTVPSYNSFRRLVPSAWASSTTAWGYDNREAALRIASPFYRREEASYNIEYKVSDPSANPYLSLGALISCGLDGIQRGLEPGEPSRRDPARLSPEERERGKVRDLPSSMAEALDLLEADAVLVDALGPLLSRCYLAVRRSEHAAFAAADVDFEIRHHYYRF
ncbi:glutamine synthetase family protein [uncultured Friedmanniella sp.]|uniref:glutamine synthetase family protein n=1 Tax=uncultured Friedmanniella sp. TaxID=335381 RepID=UPI0035CC7C25